MPGSTPATSQLDWLSSTTAMIVLSWSKATRDLLKSFSWGITALRQLFASDDGAISSSPAPYHLAAGGRWIRTLGPPSEDVCKHRDRRIASSGGADRWQNGENADLHRCVISAAEYPRQQTRPRTCVCLTGKPSCRDGH